MKKQLAALLVISLFALLPSTTLPAAHAANPAKHLSTAAQKSSLASLKDLHHGLLYSMEYTADYKLDDCLQADAIDISSLINQMQHSLLKNNTKSPVNTNPGGGCSAFTAKTETGTLLYGRNFDFKMDMTAVLIRTHPKNGYASIGLADTGWVGYGIGSLDDGKTDISMAACMPYLVMDGINEKGLTISVLKLDGAPTRQNTGKHKITTTVAIRLVLDRAATVDEAIALLKQYDMQSAMDNANFHFLLADATGKTVTLEYCANDMHVLDNTFITNYYVTPSMNGFGHGKDRYEIIEKTLAFKKNVLTTEEAMSLLSLVSQPETDESTSMTQWSALYEPNSLKMTVAIRQDYTRLFTFYVNKLS